MDQLIYKKTYENQETELPEEDIPEDALPSWDEMYRRILTGCHTVELPGRKEKVKLFLQKAARVAKLNQLGIQVIQNSGSVCVQFFLDSDSTMLGMPRLIGMADEMCILQGSDGHDLMLLLDYYTMATYHGDRKISPPDDCD